MLTGTLVTVAGFVPIGLNSSSAGEYTFTLFAVIASSLLISWVVAVLFTPLLGVTMLPKVVAAKHRRTKPVAAQTSTRCCSPRCGGAGSPSASLSCCSPLSVFGLRFVQQQFFPASDRPELLVDMTLPQNSSIAETKTQMDRFEAAWPATPTSSAGVPMSDGARSGSICRSTSSSPIRSSARL